MPYTDLKGKSVLITGGSRGLGLALVKRFRAEGCSVTAIDKVAGAQGPGPEGVRFVQADVCDETAIAGIIGGLPALDIAINNAGVNDGGAIMDTSPAVLRKVLEINVVGAYIVMRHAARRMKEAGGGHIINVVSVAAHFGMANQGPYCASKHALLGLGLSARHELSPHGIRVSAVCPGAMATDMVGDLKKDPRCLQPDDIAETIAAIARAPRELDIEEVIVRSTNWPG